MGATKAHTRPSPNDKLVTRICATILRYLPLARGFEAESRSLVQETTQMPPVTPHLALRSPAQFLARSLALPIAFAALATLTLPAGANQINTGGSGGAYETSFCPVLTQQLKLAQFDYACKTSAGTRENMERVIANPRQQGYGQLDVFALESRQMNVEAALTLVRQDDVRECVFAVTRNKDISNWGASSCRQRAPAAPAPSSSFAA